MVKSKFILIAVAVALLGCADKEEQTIAPKPSMIEIQSAIDKNVAILNERTGASIKKLSVEWVEIDESCYDHLDYFAQSIIFSRVFYPQNDYMTITCGADPSR